MRPLTTRYLLAACIAVAAPGFISHDAGAATTKVIRDEAFADFQGGEFEGVALSSDGFLFPSLDRDEIGDTKTEIIWSVLDDDKGSVLCATGHEGKLVRMSSDGEAEIIADIDEPELTELHRLPDGSALIAAAPTGRIYRLSDDDELTTHCVLDARFVWKMAADKDGDIWAATGPEGHLYRIDPESGDAELEIKLDSKNLLDLWIDSAGEFGEKGAIYIAGQSPGRLYRFTKGSEEAEVLYDSEADEIRAIQKTAEGLALAINSERAPSPQILKMTLRLAGFGAAAASEMNGDSPAGAAVDEKLFGDVFAPASPKRKGKGAPGSKVVLLTPEGFTRPLWTAPERPIHSLGIGPTGSVLVAAGKKGRLFEILPRREFALIADVREDYIVHIEPVDGGWLLAGGRNGVVFRMNDRPAADPIYRSRVIDTRSPARWGSFYWSGEAAGGQKVRVAFRRGATRDPETGGWGEWSKNKSLSAGDPVKIGDSPARFMQYRLTFDSGSKTAPLLKTDYVELFYRHTNRPPIFAEIKIGESKKSDSDRSSSNSGSSRPSSKSSSNGSRPPFGSGSSSKATPQGGGREPNSNTGNLTVSWKAIDPNGDDLQYALYFRASDETEWKVIDDELRITRVPLDVTGTGDGRYRFRVVATDAFDNPPGGGLEAEIISREFVIDNTPPIIEKLKIREGAGSTRVTFKASDALSLISSVKIDFDGGDILPVQPEDGFFDETHEEFDWESSGLDPGEHVLTIALTDRKGNTTVQRKVFTIKK